MEIESGGNGNYPPGMCRPSDGTDDVPACGPMQIKQRYHQTRCPECDFTTVPGQIELATHIIGDTMVAHKLDEYGALLKAYFPTDDVNGTTQQAYVKKVKSLVATMKGEKPPPDPDPSITRYVPHALPGSTVPLWLPSWVGYRVNLTPPGLNRRQIPMTPDRTVFHTTNNPSPGTGAYHHSRWQANGTPGHPNLAQGVYVSVHGYVDAREFVATVPINERGVHSQYNATGIALERCTNSDQDQVKGREQRDARSRWLLVHSGQDGQGRHVPSWRMGRRLPATDATVVRG